MKNKKTIFVIIIFLLIIFFILGRIVKNKGERKKIIEQESQKQSFEYRYDEFQKAYKDGYLLCLEGKDKEARKDLRESVKIWQEIIKDFSGEIPEGFKKTKNWGMEIKTILEHIEASYEFASLGKCSGVIEQTKAVNQKLGALNKENNIVSISPNLIKFGEAVAVFQKTNNKEHAQDAFLHLKIAFTEIKEIKKDKSYRKKISELEKLIADLDKYNGENWFLARDKLVKLNKEIFLEFE